MEHSMILRYLVGAALIAVSVVLMVWGQKYLGEERGRNPRQPSSSRDETLVNPCSSCGACGTCSSDEAAPDADCTHKKS